jgi:hypothetical protein
MLVTLAVWGDWHIDVFRKYGAPSLMRNLGPDDQVLIYVRHGEDAAIRSIFPSAEIAFDAGHALRAGSSPVMAQIGCWNLGRKVAQERGQVHVAIWPDVVFGDGTFDAYRAHLKAGKSVIYHHLPRVTFETAEHRLRSTGKHSLTATALENEHHLSWIYRSENPRFPGHSELINWAIPSGILTRMIATAPIVVDPRKHVVNEESQMLATFQPGQAAFIAGSDEAIALSLAPKDKDISWIPYPHEFSTHSIYQWQMTYPSPVNAELVRHSYRLGFASPADWAKAEEAADDMMERIFGKSFREAA